MIPKYASAVTQIVLPVALAPVGKGSKREAAKVDAAPLSLVGAHRAREVAVRQAALEPGARRSKRTPAG